MSPLWRDEVAIHLSPRKLALVRRAGGLRRREVAATEIALSAGGAGQLGPVMACLAGVVREKTWQGAAVRAVVADHPWARYAIVPWPATRLNEAGRLAHARYLMDDAYGEAVAGWVVSLAETPPGRASVACAMPAGLRSALEETLAPARLTLVSLQPQLIAAFNGWRRRLPDDDAWFVRIDDASLSAAHLSQGAWDRVHLARLSPSWGVELERLQAYGRVTRASGTPGRTFVDAPARIRRGTAASTGIEWLEEGDGSQPPELALLRRSHA